MSALPNWKPEPALRSEPWLKYVRSLESCQSGKRPCVAHHPVGHGRLSTLKVSDYFAIPLTGSEHNDLHSKGKGWTDWEAEHGDQYEHARRTIEQGITDGVLNWPKGGRRHGLTARELEQAIRDGVLVLDKRAAKYIAG